ncbi:hypothetical protein DSO57_1031621 [Entomophthora muscae]|uniref:Uncharacterized protein n=1 Tax=Entomophthora muscae TaxID=34485 RepID=A0ACC2TBD8_9FUNG|nr:hypothetical protein DSO57_1031621 [Entomophthora muscae]
MSPGKKSFGTSQPNSTLKDDQERDNLNERIFSSISNLASGLANPASLQNAASFGDKASSSQNIELNEAGKEFSLVANELIPSSSKINLASESFSTTLATDFEAQESDNNLSEFLHLGSLPEILEGDIDTYAINHEEKLRQYRDSVKNKSHEAEASIDKECGYFDGKFMSSHEIIESLNNKQPRAKSNPTYLADVLEEDFFEDGRDVIQLLSEPAHLEEFAEELLHSSYLLSQEESEFLELISKKYGFQENTPEDDIINYLEGSEYLEDVYGLPELHSARDRAFSSHSISMQDKQKALDRLVLLKNHMATPTDP